MTKTDNLLELIGLKIKNLRQIHNITQEDLAEILAMSASNYAKLERGEVDMTVKRLQEIAKAFGIEIGEFMVEKGSQSFTTQTVSYGVLANNQGTVQFPPDTQGISKQLEMLDMAVQKLVKRMDTLEGKIKAKTKKEVE
jgi:transcriptional regulator with XRE-family HTH domain